MRNHIRWVVMGMLIVLSFISYVLRTNFNIVAGEMSRDLHLTEQQLGLIFAAFAAGYALFQLPGGVMGNRYGARRVLAIAAAIWGILGLLTALVPGTDTLSAGAIVGSLMLIRFLVGATHAPIFPCTGGVVGNWFPRGSWGLPNGLSSTGLTLGAAAAAPIVVWLMTLFGWRGALLITAPIAFVMAGIWWWYVRDFPKDHKSVTSRELKLINENQPETDDVVPPGGWKLVLRNRDVLLLTLSYTCMNYIFYLFFSWFYYYLTEIKGFGAQEAGFLTMALWVLGAVGATAGGFACDLLTRRFGTRRGPQLLCLSGLTMVGVSLIAGILADNPYIAVAFFCLAFGATQITEASFWATAIAISGRYASTACGVMNTGGNVIGFIGALLVPWIAKTAGWDMAIASGAVFAIGGAVLWIWIRGDKPMKDPGVVAERA